ncbi:hypothetical protein F2P81_009977 [Scophthalmus maximus]|uniref:Cdc37 N-terminal domain-containing protein n=1 Tax=Scophthalmus maximus TaxID=52904 RepID=A0A6A4ST20_SCOMX|nr:hypothetical protein F2P81_009977 [Scophthalmus maximus]
MSAAAGVDYSAWDHIEVSDDEDVACAYVDTPSLFRLRHRVSSDTLSSRDVWKSYTRTWKRRVTLSYKFYGYKIMTTF